MTQKIDTKTMLGQSIKELMKKEPLEKITVCDITKNCRLRRETFYYHFIDKYDLIRWIHENEVYNKLVSDFLGAGTWGYMVKRCADWLDYFKENLDFVQNALKDDNPNGFHHILVDYTFRIISAHAKYSLKTDQLTKEMLFFVNYYAHGNVCLCEDWLRMGMPESEKFLGEIMTKSIPGDLKKIYLA